MKKIIRIAKLQFRGGQAKPGPAVASLGINIGQFCSQFNAQTQQRLGEVVPVVINVFNDKTFEFILKTTPTADLIKKAAQLDKGASEILKHKPLKTLTDAQITEIAKYKLVDLNTTSLAKAKKIVIGTMQQMGLQPAPVANQTKEQTNNGTSN